MKTNRVLSRMGTLDPVVILLLLALLTFLGLVAIALILSISQQPPPETDSLQLDEWFEVKGERTTYLVRFDSASVVDNVSCPNADARCFPRPGHKFVLIKYEGINKGSREATLSMNAELKVGEGQTYGSWYVVGGPLREIDARPGESGWGQEVFQIPEDTTPNELEGNFFGFGISDTKFKLIITPKDA